MRLSLLLIVPLIIGLSGCKLEKKVPEATGAEEAVTDEAVPPEAGAPAGIPEEEPAE